MDKESRNLKRALKRSHGEDVKNIAYDGLPAEVVAVKDRINLSHIDNKINKPFAEKFISQSAPVFYTEGFGVKYYFLEDIERKIKTRWKKKNSRSDRLSHKQKKELFTVSKQSNLKYRTFEKINSVWDEYIGTLLKNNPKDSLLKLAKADYHGAKFSVLASINPSLVGTTGIVVQETKNTFKLIDRDNQIRIIPKHGTLFAFAHKGSIYKLNGSQLKISSHQRSKVKFKSKQVGHNI